MNNQKDKIGVEFIQETRRVKKKTQLKPYIHIYGEESRLDNLLRISTTKFPIFS